MTARAVGLSLVLVWTSLGCAGARAQPAPSNPSAPDASIDGFTAPRVAEDDRDQDGVRDPHDCCPADPEDYDHFEDDDGCPEHDNDGDTIADICDVCPFEPGTMLNERAPGCPQPIRIDATTVSIVLVTAFARNAEDPLPASLAELTMLVTTLTSRPELGRLGIVGHASRNERAPDALSEARAQKVRAFLIAHGVDAERVEAHGAGARFPRRTGRTEQELSENRRVEYVLISTSDATTGQRWDAARAQYVPDPSAPPAPQVMDTGRTSRAPDGGWTIPAECAGYTMPTAPTRIAGCVSRAGDAGVVSD